MVVSMVDFRLACQLSHVNLNELGGMTPPPSPSHTPVRPWREYIELRGEYLQMLFVAVMFEDN